MTIKAKIGAIWHLTETDKQTLGLYSIPTFPLYVFVSECRNYWIAHPDVAYVSLNLGDEIEKWVDIQDLNALTSLPNSHDWIRLRDMIMMNTIFDPDFGINPWAITPEETPEETLPPIEDSVLSKNFKVDCTCHQDRVSVGLGCPKISGGECIETSPYDDYKTKHTYN